MALSLSDLDIVDRAVQSVKSGGFLALGLILLLISADIVPKPKLPYWINAGVFLGAILTMGYGTYLLTFNKPVWIEGSVLDLPHGATVQIQSDLVDPNFPIKAFIRRRADFLSNSLDFALLSRDKPGCIGLIVTREPSLESDPDNSLSEKVIDTPFRIPLDDPDFDGRTRLTVYWDAGTFKVVRIRGETPYVMSEGKLKPPNGYADQAAREDCVPIKPSSQQTPPAPTEGRQQSESSIDEISQRLRSDDAFIRRSERDALTIAGATAVPIFTALLKNSEYRLNLGAVVALSKISAGFSNPDKTTLQNALCDFKKSNSNSKERTLKIYLDKALSNLGGPC